MRRRHRRLGVEIGRGLEIARVQHVGIGADLVERAPGQTSRSSPRRRGPAGCPASGTPRRRPTPGSTPVSRRTRGTLRSACLTSGSRAPRRRISCALPHSHCGPDGLRMTPRTRVSTFALRRLLTTDCTVGPSPTNEVNSGFVCRSDNPPGTPSTSTELDDTAGARDTMKNIAASPLIDRTTASSRKRATNLTPRLTLTSASLFLLARGDPYPAARRAGEPSLHQCPALHPSIRDARCRFGVVTRTRCA